MRAADFVDVDEWDADRREVASFKGDGAGLGVYAGDAGGEEVVVGVVIATVGQRGGLEGERIEFGARPDEGLPSVGKFVPVDVGAPVLGVVLAGEDTADLAIRPLVAVAELDAGRDGGAERHEAPLAEEGVLIAQPDVEEAVERVGSGLSVALHPLEVEALRRRDQTRGRHEGRVLDLPVDQAGHQLARGFAEVVVDGAAAEALQALVGVLADIRGDARLVLVDGDGDGCGDLGLAGDRGDTAVLVVELDGYAPSAGDVVDVGGGSLGAVMALARRAVAPGDHGVEGVLVGSHVGARPADRVGEALAAAGRLPALRRADENRVLVDDVD